MAAAPLPLQEWIERAGASIPNELYVECAITVASELTHHLCLIVGTDDCVRDSENSSSAGSADLDLFDSLSGEEKTASDGIFPSRWSRPVQLDDIAPENVLIWVVANNNGVATEVGIQPATNSEPCQISSRDACFALGKILLHLFSRGSASLPIYLGDDGSRYQNFDDSFAQLLLDAIGLNVDDTNPPASKRSASSTARRSSPPSTSARAKAYLQGRGIPLSICQLISDLLEADGRNEFVSDTALLSLEEARYDLMQMKAHPQRFLHDQTCPRQALDNTTLFNQADGELYGREREKRILMDVAGRVALHVPAPCGAKDGGGQQHPSAVEAGTFLCEAAFLSGHGGSGKSCIIRELVSYCDASDWSVLFCKFDRQAAPPSVLLQSVDGFFGKFLARHSLIEPALQDTFDRISRSIRSSIDIDSYTQLCELLPNFGRLFQMPMHSSQWRATHDDVVLEREDGSMANVKNQTPRGVIGSGKNRLNYLFRIILKALCSGGQPVAMVLEDLQWSDAATIDILEDFIQAAGYGSVDAAEGGSLGGGLLYLGSFRDDEVDQGGFLSSHIESLERSQGNINSTNIVVGELSERNVNEMLSFKFCLPMRHARQLAELVYQKTRGHPMYAIEFLRSIVRRNLIAFSVKDRRWVWDDICIDMQLISEGVVELLTRKLGQLPDDVIETLKIVSCFGCQINTTTIRSLDLGQFVPDMSEALELAMKEGIVEKAGPIVAFSHDMLQEATYNLIPVDERKLFHKRIGTSLIQCAEAQSPELCVLASDQINLCTNLCKDLDGILSPVDRATFARLNLAAGKHSMRASSFEQARGYFESGITLLHDKAWDRQYSLCWELFANSVEVSFMDGKLETVAGRLNEMLPNARTFDDKLNARAMLAKLRVSQERYEDGVKGILEILIDLGETFPQSIDQSLVSREMKATLPLLRDISREKILCLPAMTDPQKLKAMKFMGILQTVLHFYSPLFGHLLSCRMIQLTFESGFCEPDSIQALIFIAHGLILDFPDEMELSKNINRIGETLIGEYPNEHSLRAMLTPKSAGVYSIVAPFQASAPKIMDGYNSATIVGDTDNAMFCAFMYCIGSFCCIAELTGLQKNVVKFMIEMARNNRSGLLHSTMSCFSSCTALIGNENSPSFYGRIEMKENSELFQIANQTQNAYLMHHVIMNQMFVNCYFRDHLCVVHLAEEYEINYTGKRTLDFIPVFYGGISAFCLARDTKQAKWKEIGEKSILAMEKLEASCTWNFENKVLLLQAEAHYLNRRHRMAEVAYQSAIVSAFEHRFIHEEALASELYGIYLVENKNIDQGLKQLQIAMGKYKKWGAMKKADAVKDFIELIEQPCRLWKA